MLALEGPSLAFHAPLSLSIALALSVSGEPDPGVFLSSSQLLSSLTVLKAFSSKLWDRASMGCCTPRSGWVTWAFGTGMCAPPNVFTCVHGMANIVLHTVDGFFSSIVESSINILIIGDRSRERKGKKRLQDLALWLLLGPPIKASWSSSDHALGVASLECVFAGVLHSQEGEAPVYKLKYND